MKRRPTHPLLPRWTMGTLMMLLLALPLWARPKAPDWMVAASKLPVNVETGDATAVVLWDEGQVEIERTGRVNHHTRWVIRLLADEGRDHATALASYVDGAGKVSSIEAWLLSPDGTVREYGKKQRVDVAAHTNALELYGESRYAVLAGASDVAREGDVFAYEIKWRDETDWAELGWTFRSELPVVHSRLAVTLPDGWDLRTKFYNHPGVTTERSGQTYAWTLRDLPAVEDEAWRPRVAASSIGMSVAFIAPANETRTRNMIGVETWPELVGYFAADYAQASTPDAAVQQLVDETLAGATDNWERIQRLCRLAQDVRYISVALDMGRSGGYRPRAAAEVQRVGYGDCKDKSVYLRALLRAAGLEGRELLVSSQARYEIDEAWVSPSWFNHCVLTIPLDESAPAEVASFTGPQGRRWLVFDPTDEFTPPGQLDVEGLSAQGLWFAADEGGIIQLPPLNPARSVIERDTQVTLTTDGTATGTMQVTYRGDDAGPMRAWARRTTDDERRRGLRNWFSDRWTAPTVNRLEVKDAFAEDALTLDLEFEGEGYARLMRNVLYVFSPVMLPTDLPRFQAAEERVNPIWLQAGRTVERTTFVLPEGYIIDEAPEDEAVETEFGRYVFKTSYDETSHQVLVERELEWRSGRWAPDLAEQVEDFVDRVRVTEQTPFVLERD